MAVANNADDYTNGRVNIFFPANSSPPSGNNGDLTGQCVSLVKWFMAEMCDGFPNPFAARGDARYVGQNLVAQGLAVEVPYANRQRGDVICLEFGTYGHIYVQLSGGRVFEENVNWAGVASAVVSGMTVHASRIGSDSEAWRTSLNPHAYRLKNYVEKGADIMSEDALKRLHHLAMGTPAGPAFISTFTGQPVEAALKQLENDPNHLLMGKDTLTRVHRLAIGAEPGPDYLAAFMDGALVPVLSQLEGDPNRLNNKPLLNPTTLAPGVYKVN